MARKEERGNDEGNGERERATCPRLVKLQRQLPAGRSTAGIINSILSGFYRQPRRHGAPPREAHNRNRHSIELASTNGANGEIQIELIARLIQPIIIAARRGFYSIPARFSHRTLRIPEKGVPPGSCLNIPSIIINLGHGGVEGNAVGVVDQCETTTTTTTDQILLFPIGIVDIHRISLSSIHGNTA